MAGGAKNLWVRTGHLWNLNFCTYNIRTLLDNDKLDELEFKLNNIKWDIVGLSESKKGRRQNATKQWKYPNVERL